MSTKYIGTNSIATKKISNVVNCVREIVSPKLGSHEGYCETQRFTGITVSQLSSLVVVIPHRKHPHLSPL